ncbi:MAG: N-acetylneuraminate synthase family protein [Phycisphaerales bacterium]|nr:N-acetylneuraminate synthase family protein [Planctomycetota bacterium]MCH8507961.1 N-acetylneuraminate synthase family protein [Phycisphaerales bacterium]
MKIGTRDIGLDHPPYIIAEIGVNHDGEVARAMELTDAAAEAGADAVKLQYFETDRLMSKAAKLAAYQKAAGETDPVAMLRRLELTLDEMALVVERAHSKGIHAIVTVFSTELVEPAETLAWDAYKTASPDIVNRPLLEALAATGKPLIVSTGASTLDEVVRAAGWLDSARDRLALLQCVSSYPAPEAAYEGIMAIASATHLPIGYSDHLLRKDQASLPVAAGACILEKHITDDRTRPGPDHRASILTGQMAEYISSARSGSSGRAWVERASQARRTHPDEESGRIWAAEQGDANRFAAHLGYIIAGFCSAKSVLDCERDVRTVSRQSVVSTRPIPAGTVIGREHLTIKRPGTGILAYRFDEVLGRTAARDIQGDVPILDDDLRPV